MTQNNADSVKRETKGGIVAVYGAGSLGKWAVETLAAMNIKVDYFVDDNKNKQGHEIDGVLCISYDKLRALSEKEKTFVVLGSTVTAITGKLEKLNVTVYSLASMWQELKWDVISGFLTMKQTEEEWEDKWKKVNAFLADDNSIAIWNWGRNIAKTGNGWEGTAPKIATSEEHYFVSPIPKLLNENSVIVDCGAYDGDMWGQLERLDIKYKRIYSLEANPYVYARLEKNLEKIQNEKIRPICGALYDRTGTMRFNAIDENVSDTCGHLCYDENVPHPGGG